MRILVNLLKIAKRVIPRDMFSCHIVEVDTTSQEVVLHVRNKTVFLRCKFSEAISDLNVIGKLAPCEACWLGGYYGRHLMASLEGRDSLKKNGALNHLLEEPKARYQIILQERTGKVLYFDKVSNQEILEDPLVIVRHPHIISEFDSAQACYLGILAGIHMEKLKAKDKKSGSQEFEELLGKSPKLRIVK